MGAVRRNLLPGETDNVLFSIKPIQGLPSGTEIRNSAEIQFEVFNPLVTPEVLNVIDATPPSCAMDPLPAQTFTADFDLAWSGTDAVGEIESYSIFVTEDGGNFELFLETADTSATFPGMQNTAYGFFCVAKDTANNVEDQNLASETTTTVVAPTSVWAFSGTAQGGTVEFTIENVMLVVVTAAGETAADVGANVAAAINADSTLSAAGITAMASGNTVFTNGVVSSTSINDAGISHHSMSGIPTSGLVASYFFSGNTNDSTGTAHGVASGAVLTDDRFGTPNSAYSFDGIDDFVEAPASALPTADRTVSLWFKADSVAGRPCAMGYGGGPPGPPGESWFMCLNTAGGMDFHMSSHWGTNAISYPYEAPPLGVWFHFAVTTAPDGTRLYVNGVEKVSNAIHVSNTTASGTDLAIGVIVNEVGIAPYTDANVGYFDGSIDDVLIYDRALSPSEIQELIAIVPVTALDLAGLVFLAALVLGTSIWVIRRSPKAV